jgi:hypothetical protein
MPVNSFPTWRIDPFSVHSRLRATAEEADALGDNNGKVTKAETELLAKVYEDKGFSSGADNARATWSKLEQDGVSNILVSIPGAIARGIFSGLEALESKLFENVR